MEQRVRGGERLAWNPRHRALLYQFVMVPLNSLLGAASATLQFSDARGLQETPLHFDSYDNFLCQVAGSKYVRLYAPDQTRYLYVSRNDQHGSMRNSQGNVSDVRVEAPDLAKHSEFTRAQFSHTILNPGDLLFIPARHWHYVRSTSTSISVNFWF